MPRGQKHCPSCSPLCFQYFAYMAYTRRSINIFLKIVFILFLERGREGEREGEKHHMVAPHTPPTGDLAQATQACALTGN